MKRLFMLLLIVTLAAAACDRIDIQQGPDGLNITVGLSESEVNTIVSTIIAESQNPVVSNPSVDLQPGRMVVSGQYEGRSGSVTLELSVANGTVNVRATSVNVEGMDTTDEQLTNFNEELARRLGAVALGDNTGARLTALTITNDQLRFTITLSN